MNLTQLLHQCDQRAGFNYGWEDFVPIGLLMYPGGTAQAVKAPGGATVADACMALSRAARNEAKRIDAIGLVCSGWASKTAPTLGIDPAKAEDRQRARVTYAADRSRTLHVYTNIGGSTNYERILDPPLGIGTVLCDIITDATGMATLTCSTGQHERQILL